MIKAVVIPTSIKDKPYITEIEDYASYYKIIDCRTFDLVTLKETDSVSVDCYVDDEGILNNSERNYYFQRAYDLGHIYQPLFGIGVITLTDNDSGESIDLNIPIVRKTLLELGFTDKELKNLK
jgi:hypothetical protein